MDCGAEFRWELILMNVVVDVITDCWMLSFIWFIRLWLLPIQSNTSLRPLQRINHYLQKESILNTKYPFSLEIFPLSRFMFCLKFSCYWKYEVLNLSIVIWQQHFTCPHIREEIKWLSEISLLDRRLIYWKFIHLEGTRNISISNKSIQPCLVLVLV